MTTRFRGLLTRACALGAPHQRSCGSGGLAAGSFSGGSTSLSSSPWFVARRAFRGSAARARRAPGEGAEEGVGAGAEAEEADTYRGPGGLTARQIFEAMQAGGKAAGDPYWRQDGELAEELKFSDAEALPQDLTALKVGQLQEALHRRGLRSDDCFDKESLVLRLQRALEEGGGGH